MVGVEAAFEEYVLTRGAALVGYAYVLCGDRHLAEDLVQEVLVRVARRWDQIEGPADPYVRTAVARELTSWRRRRSNAEIPSVLPDRPGGFAPDAAVERDPLWRLLQMLPVRQRAVLVLRHWEGLDDIEIAELLGCRRATVRSLAARAAATLRDHPDLVRLSRNES